MESQLPISICIIAKNEEKNIERCLKSLSMSGGEIVFVDTGSKDNTKEIAQRYTKNIFEYEWCDDFSAAKNFAVSKASNKCVMVLDSDEYIEKIDVQKLYKQITQNICEVGRVQRRNYYSSNGVKRENIEWISRIFWKDRFQYEGRIHEQIVSRNGDSYDMYDAPIVIGHTGYDLTEEQKRQKAQRNISLLLNEYTRLKQNNDNEKIPYILFQLGKSYFWIKEFEQSCKCFGEGLSYDLDTRLEYVSDMVETYGYALLESGRKKEALQFENIYDEFCRSADFQFLMGLIYMNNAMFDKAINEFEKATTHQECHMVGNNSYLAFYNIGVIYECLGVKDKAQQYYEKCGDYEPAVNQKNKLN